MHSDAFGCVRKPSDAFVQFWEISKKIEKSFLKCVFQDFRWVLEQLEANGPQNQLPHQILLQIHLSSGLCDPKLSFESDFNQKVLPPLFSPVPQKGYLPYFFASPGGLYYREGELKFNRLQKTLMGLI